MNIVHKVVLSIKTHLDFLFQDGFELIKFESGHGFGNWIAYLESNKIRMRILQDRNEISCTLMPRWKRNTIYNRHHIDLEAIIAFIEKKEVSYRFYDSSSRNQDIQLNLISENLRKNYENIISLFEKKNYLSIEKNLSLFLEKRKEYFFGQYGYKSRKSSK